MFFITTTTSPATNTTTITNDIAPTAFANPNAAYIIITVPSTVTITTISETISQHAIAETSITQLAGPYP